MKSMSCQFLAQSPFHEEHLVSGEDDDRGDLIVERAVANRENLAIATV
jgi:hypothetical protein